MNLKKFFKNVSFLFCPIIFISCISALSILKGTDIKFIINKNDTQNKEIPEKENFGITQKFSSNKNQEMRAVWVPFMDIDMKSDCSIDKFENKIDDIIINAKNNKINTLIVHIRSHSDALYPSKIFPWSHLLTGLQGQDPGFDPLKIIIEKTHKENMKIHAWINPFRIQCAGAPKNICKSNPATLLADEADCILKDGDDIYYNPANEKVQKLIIDGIKEVVQNYDVDAIHLDDRFYPTDSEAFDKESYNNYLNIKDFENNKLDLYKWRQSNINNLIFNIYKEIKSINSNILFGISPEGNINNAEKHGVDAKRWCSQTGYVDYICPQLYWSLDNPALDFKTAANNWKNILKLDSVNLYFGLSLYKIGTDLDENTWKLYDNDILKREIEYSRSIGCQGFMLYPYNCLVKPEVQKELLNVAKIFN